MATEGVQLSLMPLCTGDAKFLVSSPLVCILEHDFTSNVLAVYMPFIMDST